MRRPKNNLTNLIAMTSSDQLSDKITRLQNLIPDAKRRPLSIASETGLKMIQEHDPDAVSLITSDRNLYFNLKRVLDILISTILLIVLSPIMLVTAIAVYLSSPGPVFFSQERVGVKKKFFKKQAYWQKTTYQNYKFRTMMQNADTSIHQAFIKALIENNENEMEALQQGGTNHSRKLVNDRRVIRGGRFLRKFSLDELPQFWNVIRGDMSLVGPRPPIPYEVEMYRPWHLRRLETLPGITGLQQVQARSTDFDQQVCLDIEYIENQSLWLDLSIMAKTLWAVLSTKGAY